MCYTHIALPDKSGFKATKALVELLSIHIALRWSAKIGRIAYSIDISLRWSESRALYGWGNRWIFNNWRLGL